jgi:hypothetical protein
MLSIFLFYVLWVVVLAVLAGRFCGLNEKDEIKKRAKRAIRRKDEIF